MGLLGNAISSPLSDDNVLYWLIYEVILILFFFIFLFVYHRGKTEYRPYTHKKFERLRIASVLSILFNIIWTFQFIFKHTKTVSIIFGSLSDAIMAVIVCLVTKQIIRNYFSLKTREIPNLIKYYLYSWLIMTFVNIFFRLLAFSLTSSFVDDLYEYEIFVITGFNASFFLLLFSFIVAFIFWLLVEHHKISFMEDKEETNGFGAMSDITVGGVKSVYICNHRTTYKYNVGEKLYRKMTKRLKRSYCVLLDYCLYFVHILDSLLLQIYIQSLYLIMIHMIDIK